MSSGRPLTVAAVDLGSNSFHMVIARLLDNDLHILDRLREPVRLADGLAGRGEFVPEVADRAIACLERFGQRLRGTPAARVRAVGTSTLRRASRARGFSERARQALGYPVEIISGQEEARLIYLGIAHTLPVEDRRRLAVDIGGGSTEIIVGQGLEPLLVHSLQLGCVGLSRTHFPKGVITRDAFRAADTAAALELRAVREEIRALGWEAALGSSGTINAISELLRSNGWDGPEITLPRLKKLRKALCGFGHVDKIQLEALRPDRAAVLPGGLAILMAIFKSLSVESMVPSSGALREGVLYDLIGRLEHHDVRDRTIRRLVEQYRVDLAQAGRVERAALGLYAQLETAWQRDGDIEPEPGAARKLLTWASLLHEIGLTVAYSGHHKHGAYLVTHLDLPGFSADDQRVLAALIRGQRRRLSDVVFDPVPEDRVAFARRLVVPLRLAILLNRSRLAEPAALPEIVPDGDRYTLRFPAGWMANHPLTRADLKREAAYLKEAGIGLAVRESPKK